MNHTRGDHDDRTNKKKAATSPVHRLSFHRVSLYEIGSVRKYSNLNGTLDRKASAVQFDALDLMNRLRSHMAFPTIRAINDRNVLD